MTQTYDKERAREKFLNEYPKARNRSETTEYQEWTKKRSEAGSVRAGKSSLQMIEEILGKKVSKFYYSNGRDRIREIVRIRDNHTCQNCGAGWLQGERRFDVHHLNGLCGKLSRACDKLKDIDGLITLCHKCHFNHPEHSRMKVNNVNSVNNGSIKL